MARAAQFHQVLTQYRARQWDAAQVILQGLGSEDSVLLELYLNRIRQMRLHPPGEAWDGVTTFHSK